MRDESPTPGRVAIGHRLAEERVAKRLNQDQLAEAVGKSRRSVAAWEAGDSMPDADSLAVADQMGIDVLYVITGRRGGVLSEQQSLLVSYTKGMPDEAMQVTLQSARVLGHYSVGVQQRSDPTVGTVAATQQGSKATFHQSFHDKVGQVIDGDMTIQGNLSLKMSDSKKGKQPKS